MKRTALKTHNHYYYSPLSVIKNYIKQTKTSVQQFFKQYLKPQGSNKLLMFNRYMLIAMIINIDIKLLVTITIIVYIVVKLIKVKPWNKNAQNSIPLSFVNKKNRIRKKLQQQQKNKQLQQKKKASSETHNLNSSQNFLFNLYLKKQQTKPSKNLQPNTSNQQIIGNFHSADIQKFIYQAINKAISSIQNLIWFLKWKSILILFIISLLIYLIQPCQNLNKDAFHIVATHQDGDIQIHSIKRTSELINQFYLILIWLVTNMILFYKYGTTLLKKELLEEIYTRQYHHENLRKSKFKGKRFFTGLDDTSLKLTSRQKSTIDIEPIELSPRKSSTVLKHKSDKKIQKININQLKMDSAKFSKFKDQNFKNEQQNKPKLNQQIEQKLEKKVPNQDQLLIQFVDSQQAFSDNDQQANLKKNSQNKLKQPPKIIETNTCFNLSNTSQQKQQKKIDFFNNYSTINNNTTITNNNNSQNSAWATKYGSSPKRKYQDQQNQSITNQKIVNIQQSKPKLVKVSSMFLNNIGVSSQQNLLQGSNVKKRKASDQTKYPRKDSEQYKSRKNKNDFKIKLLDVQLTSSFAQ